jgi:site-specific DNA recombinase
MPCTRCRLMGLPKPAFLLRVLAAAHSVGCQRYRYYISHVLLQHRSDAAGSLPRIPAPAIETLVADRVARLLSAAVNRDPASIAESVQKTIRRIEVSNRQVTLLVDRGVVVSLEAAQHRLGKEDKVTDSGETLTIAIPIRLKAWGGEVVIEGPNGALVSDATNRDQSLIDALVRAHEWRDLMASGKAKSFRAVARQVGCTEGYVRQIVELSFLAPKLTASILRGTQPRHVTVDRLVRQPIPLSWREQRRALGLAG